MPRDHIVKSFDKDLNRLRRLILTMGQYVESQLTAAAKLLQSQDERVAAKISANKTRLNSMAHEVDHLTIHLLALRQPLAIDLRTIVSALKIAADLGKIGEYTVCIANHMNGVSPTNSGQVLPPLQQMALLALKMLSDTMQAYDLLNVGKAVDVWNRDHEIDAIYSDLLGEFRPLMERNPENIEVFTSLLFIARSLERIGDHIKNVDEHIYFMVSGQTYGQTPIALQH